MSYSIAYRDSPLPPVFGGRTARASFCEEDFIITGWVGEFVNTVSNLAYFFYAYQGLRRRRTAESSWASDILYYSLGLVGLCSALFHGLVKYYAQLSDDTSMQIATACCLHRALTFGKSKQYSSNVALILIGSISIETLYHSYMDEHVVHELTFLLLILLVAGRTRSLINERIKRIEDKRNLKRLSLFGIACFLFGYLLWQLDFIYCSQLTVWKRAMGMPWSFVLEFHGWWHIFTAIGAYVFMVMVDSLTQDVVDLSGGPFAWLGGKRSQDTASKSS